VWHFRRLPARRYADWLKHAAKMCDGGTMAFGAVFDLNRQGFDSFTFNGDV
jgi:hypothetical protein